MIWSDGKILPDDGLTIDANDRTFEHGLGLFETLRTWGGRPTLLGEHKARMLRSADELQLPVDPATLPDAEAVRALLEAEGFGEGRMLRITASGGTAGGPSVVWMKSSPLPGPTGEGGVSLLLDSWRVDPDDPMARHKTLNYWPRRLVFEEARRRGFDEALSVAFDDQGESGHLEGSRTNLFAIVNSGLGWFKKHRASLLTPSTRRPIVPGVMRGEVLKVVCEELSGEVEILDDADGVYLGLADEVFLTNSVRGIIPVARAVLSGTDADRHRWPAPGPWTARIQELLARRLWPDRGAVP